MTDRNALAFLDFTLELLQRKSPQFDYYVSTCNAGDAVSDTLEAVGYTSLPDVAEALVALALSN